MNRIVTSLICIIMIVVTFRFWFGVYDHDEFAETELFMKHRPIWQWKFYSPIGMSDMRFEDLSEEKQKEQLLFKEFVTDQHLSR